MRSTGTPMVTNRGMTGTVTSLPIPSLPGTLMHLAQPASQSHSSQTVAAAFLKAVIGMYAGSISSCQWRFQATGMMSTCRCSPCQHDVG